MNIDPKDFELNAKEAAAIMATVVLTGIGIGIGLIITNL